LWVLSSSGGAARETAGEYAEFFNPYDSNELINKLTTLLLTKVTYAPRNYYQKFSQPDVNHQYWNIIRNISI